MCRIMPEFATKLTEPSDCLKTPWCCGDGAEVQILRCNQGILNTQKTDVYNIQSIYLVNIVLLKICRIPLSWLLRGMENLVTLLSNYEVCMNGNVCERKNSGKLLHWKLFINFPCKMSTKTSSETPFLEVCIEEASLDLALKALNFRPICTGEMYLLKSYFLQLATLPSSSSSVNDFQSSQKVLWCKSKSVEAFTTIWNRFSDARVNGTTRLTIRSFLISLSLQTSVSSQVTSMKTTKRFSLPGAKTPAVPCFAASH